MLPLGRMNRIVRIENPVTAKDALGSPVQVWVPYVTAYAAIENDTYTAEENNAAPHESATQTRTYVMRNHPDYNFNTHQRLLDEAATFAIAAIRYSANGAQCFLDCISGASDG